MNKEGRPNKEINPNIPRVILVVGIVLIVFAPFILTRQGCEYLDFTNTGQIGDTIGGITAPIVNLIAAILVYYAFTAQVKANEIIQKQFDEDNKAKEIDAETQNLNKLYEYIRDSIDNFKYRCLNDGYEPIKDDNGILHDGEYEKGSLTEKIGSSAFYMCFSHIRCNYHGTEDDLLKDPCVSEIYSVLVLINELLDNISRSNAKNKTILKKLIDHLFNYKVIVSIREESYDSLKVEYCDHCNRNHGVPNNILNIIEEIKTKLSQ